MAEHPRDNKEENDGPRSVQELFQDQSPPSSPSAHFIPQPPSFMMHPVTGPFDPNIINNFLAEWQKSKQIKQKYLEQKTLFYIKENELLQYEIDQLNENDGPVFIDHREEKK